MNRKAESNIITTILIILLVLAAIVIVWQVINTGLNFEEDSRNDDYYASKYIKEFYPEYKDCSVEYSKKLEGCSSIYCPYYKGAKVYCDQLPLNKDGLKVHRPGEPTIKIEFKDITLKEIKNYYKINLVLRN